MLIPRHIEILESRGLDGETMSRLGWKTVEGQNDGSDWIEIPYFRRGEVVGRKFRTITGEKKFYQEKGSEQCLYNLDCLQELSEAIPVVITEGEMDCVIAIQCGYIAVSVPNGAPSREIADEDTKKFDYLDDLPDRNPVILAVDGDGPGAILLHELAKRIGRARCQWIRYPKKLIPDGAGGERQIKDLNEVFQIYGQKGVEEVFKRAEWVKLDGLYRMSEITPAAEFPAMDCMIDGFGDYYKIRQGDVSVVTGMPSHGKTTFVNEVICNMAWHHGWNICVGSFEQNPKPDHQRYLRTYHLRKPANLVPDQSENMKAADAWIENHFYFIIPDVDSEEFATIDWLLERAAQAVLRHSCKLIVIDPWNEMDHHRPQGMSLTEYTGWAIKQIKRFARKYQVHVIVVAHPSKMERGKDGTYPMPTLYDISDSSHWFNKPDIGIIVHRNEYMLNQIKVQKCRYVGTIGQPGSIWMQYDTYQGIFIHLTQSEVDEHIEIWKKKNPKPLDGADQPNKWWKKKGKQKSAVAQPDLLG